MVRERASITEAFVGGPARHLLTIGMGNSPSIPGLGGGRSPVRRDYGYVDSDRGRRPEQIQKRDTDIDEDEEVERGVDIVNVPEFYVGHNGARPVGLMPSAEEEIPSDGDNQNYARQMGRRAVEINAVASRGPAASDYASRGPAASDHASKGPAESDHASRAIFVDEAASRAESASESASKPANRGSNRQEATMCDEITSNELDERDMNWRNNPFRVTERSDSSSVESVHPPERRSAVELGGQRICERKSVVEHEQLQDLRAELSNELRAQQAMFLSARDEFENRQADTLANAWAVLEQSIASLKSPAEVNGPREIRPEGDEVQVNSLSVNGNAPSTSAPVVYPSYELGEQGIPVVIPGGMPSGVPPSVYLSQVDAMNQQCVDRYRTPVMIPGGMPSGVPSSVYRPPVDALNQQFVSQYCSPELFSPMDSAYYTAPNTCLRVRNGNWSTEATPGNSQLQNEITFSQEAAEADSGLGRTGSGYSLRNSRSQHEELRDEQAFTSRPAPKSATTGSKKTVKHASFKDDQRALSFGSSSDTDEEPDRN